VWCVRDSERHCHRNYYTDILEAKFKPAKVCYTENDREQIKKWCNLAMGFKEKGLKQMRVNKILGWSPPVVKSVSLRECLKWYRHSVSVQIRQDVKTMNNLKGDVAVRGLHESFLKWYFKHYIIGFVRFCKNLNGANILPSTEISFINFLWRRIQKLFSGNIYSLYPHTS